MSDQNNIPISGDYSNSFNEYVYRKVNNAEICLDVGCWTGNLGTRLIKNKGCTIDGIDYVQDSLKKAKQNGYRETYSINLNSGNLDISQLRNKYDCIIFADVLEHTVNPENILKSFKRFLNKDGHIIVSVPNVAFLQTRLNLLMGKWDYSEFGILDKTHLKFYTLGTARNLIANAGYKITSANTYNQFDPLTKFGFFRKMMPTVFGYQILVTAKNNE